MRKTRKELDGKIMTWYHNWPHFADYSREAQDAQICFCIILSVFLGNGEF